MLKSIYARTFLLMLATMLIAQVVAVILPTSRFDPSDAPIRLEDIARDLNGLPDEGPPPSPPGGEGRRGPPPPETTLPLNDRPPAGHQGETRVSDAPPAQPGMAQSAPSAERLAFLLKVPNSDVLFYAKDAARLSRGFIAAVHQPDLKWRVVSRPVEAFPSTGQQRALEVLALELLCLLPLAWIFARALSAPIRRFADAARRVGQDPHTAPLPREGPAEMLAAVDSFNAMQARLNRLIQERTRMVAAIAHDLRTPLTRLAFRLDDLPPPAGDKVREDIHEMKSMISAALDFIRDRSVTGQRERLEFRLLVERVVNDQNDLGHEVSLEPGPSVTLEGVPLALRRMVSNLIENAVKYGERARLRIELDDAYCILDVDDDGPGIPQAQQEQVFEPFFRLEGSRNRDTGGIGLGLAAVRAIALEHAGEVTLANRKSGGLRVSVHLPLLRR